jgi:hypothetical protein
MMAAASATPGALRPCTADSARRESSHPPTSKRGRSGGPPQAAATAVPAMPITSAAGARGLQLGRRRLILIISALPLP